MARAIKEQKTIKVYISCQGDRSVGIWPDQSVLTMEKRFVPSPGSGDEEWRQNRKWLRGELARLFTDLFDEPASVVFEDECPDCQRLRAECKCKEEVL